MLAREREREREARREKRERRERERKASARARVRLRERREETKTITRGEREISKTARIRRARERFEVREIRETASRVVRREREREKREQERKRFPLFASVFSSSSSSPSYLFFYLPFSYFYRFVFFVNPLRFVTWQKKKRFRIPTTVRFFFLAREKRGRKRVGSRGRGKKKPSKPYQESLSCFPPLTTRSAWQIASSSSFF